MNRLLLLFIPHEKNNHRAELLKPWTLILLIALYLLNQSILKTLSIVKPGVLGYSSEITTQKVFVHTNQEREKLGLPAYHFNSTLSISAQKKAQDMFKNDYWAHNSPQGKTPWEFFDEAGYQYSVAGENLAKDFSNTDSMMKAWMNSPTHKANIVNDKYQEIGIAVVDGVLDGLKTTLVVQHFGTPLNGVVKDNTTDEIAFNSNSNYKPEVLSGQNQNPINPLKVSKVFGVIMFILIILILALDSYITLKNSTHRLTGSAASHIGFLAIILLFMIFSQQGHIF